jgi:hypothetical protein
MQGRTSWCQDIIAGLCLVTALLMGGVSEKDVSGLLTVFVIVGQGVCECVCVGGGGGGEGDGGPWSCLPQATM